MQRDVVSLDKYTSVGPDNTYANKSMIVIIKMIGTEVESNLVTSSQTTENYYFTFITLHGFSHSFTEFQSWVDEI